MVLLYKLQTHPREKAKRDEACDHRPGEGGW